MKNLIIGFVAIFSISTFAKDIQGTLLLKGSLRTKIVVNTVKTTCRVKVEKVKNLMQEDSYGNPAYQVRVDISLDGSDPARNLRVKHNKEVMFTNLFQVGTTSEVRDEEYAAADGSKLLITDQGRLRSVTFPFSSQKITCTF
jgi:hypothetical protein